jgi:hypothetical protein
MMDPPNMGPGRVACGMFEDGAVTPSKYTWDQSWSGDPRVLSSEASLPAQVRGTHPYPGHVPQVDRF